MSTRLQCDAQRDDLPLRIRSVEDAMCSFTELAGPTAAATASTAAVVDDSSGVDSQPSASSQQQQSQSQQQQRKARSTATAAAAVARDRNGKNSLAQLCRRFIMVLLSVSRLVTINLYFGQPSSRLLRRLLLSSSSIVSTRWLLSDEWSSSLLNDSTRPRHSQSHVVDHRRHSRVQSAATIDDDERAPRLNS